jgi:hypothetical protein
VIGRHPRANSQFADPVKKFSDTWTGRLRRALGEAEPLPPCRNRRKQPVVSIIDSESNLVSQASAWISPETMECVAQLMEEQNAPSR